MVLSTIIDKPCFQIFPALSCKSGIGRYLYVEVASHYILSSLGTKNFFCFSDLRQCQFPVDFVVQLVFFLGVRRGKCRSMKMHVLETKRTSSPHVNIITYI